jgi:ribonuclease P protein component
MKFDFRLKKEKDFEIVFKKGKRIFSKNLTLVYVPADFLKAGFAVSKKHGGSVKRNKIKRLLRESFRSFLPNLLEVGKNFFFVFIPKQNDDYNLVELKKEMDYLFKKGGFLV